jgi:hypothetical protein
VTLHGVSRDASQQVVITGRRRGGAISSTATAEVSGNHRCRLRRAINPCLRAATRSLAVVPANQTTLWASPRPWPTTTRSAPDRDARGVAAAGTASLSWGGLKDSAGNAVAGTVAATWNVARTALLAEFGDQAGRVGIATNNAGAVFELHKRNSDGALVVARFDGSAFVPFGPAVNDRALGTDLVGSIAVDASGRCSSPLRRSMSPARRPRCWCGVSTPSPRPG